MTDVLPRSIARPQPTVVNWRSIAARTFLYAVIAAGALIFALPFLWMISTSVKPGPEVYVIPPRWIPSSFNWSNYVEPWRNLPFLTFYKNTMIVTGVSIVATLISSSLVAFGFARVRFRGRGLLFTLVISTLMLPPQVTLVPLYLLFTKFGMINTLWPLIVPSFFGHAFSIFLLRQYMMTIPHEMDDAARIDGCGWFDIYWRIVLPLSRPALGVVAIFSFQAHWSDFFNPLIYLNTSDQFTVPLGLALLNSRYATAVQQTMAMTLISVIPMVLVFVIAQKKFIQGLTITGVKG